MKWHPFAERFPLLEGAEWESFKKSIAKTKGNKVPVVYRWVDGEKQGIDGRNRLRACEELGLPCLLEADDLEDADVKEFILVRNVHRRHLTPELRKELVSELRADGRSTRQIAEVLGVSQATVARDVVSTESNDSVETVKGKDGKTRTARKTELCDRCKRVGKTKDCAACKELRTDKKAREPGDDTEVEKEAKRAIKDHKKDAEGHDIPEALQPAFDSLFIFEVCDSHCFALQKEIARLAALPGAEQFRRHTKTVGDEKKTTQKLEELDTIKRHLKYTRPHSVCPYCQGKGPKSCHGCAGLGWVTRVTWKGAEEHEKARLA